MTFTDDRRFYDIRDESELEPLLQKICKTMPSANILEFGAYDGAVTSKFLRWMPTPPAAYFLFEPDVRNVPKIKARSDIQAHTTLVQAAVSDKDGTEVLHLSGSTFPDHHDVWTMSSSLKKPTPNMDNKYPWLTYPNSVEVETRSIDSFCAEHGLTHLDLIWADIEGNEDKLIAGAKEMLPHTKWLYLETDPLHLFEGGMDTTQILTALPNWKVHTCFPVDVLFENTLLP